MRATQFLSELSNELLARYKKAAGADAKKADAEGDYERGNKRFKGINKATFKQFDNDAKERKLDEKSTTEKQARFMAAAAHDPQFAARAGIKQSVAKEFNKADTGTKKLSNAMKHKPKKKGFSEGEVVKFPKKHKGDLENTHDCPKCGGDLQGGKYMGHQVKVCMPCKQVYLPPNSGIDQKGNKIENEGVAEGERVKTASGMYRDQHTGVAYRGKTGQDGNDSYMTPDYLIQKYQERLAQIASGPYKRPKEVAQLKSRIAKLQGQASVNEVAMRMQGSSQSEKDATAREKARQAEELAKHQAIVKAYVDIMAAGQSLPPKMQQSYNTMPDFRKEVDAALANIPGQPGRVDLEQRRNYHLMPKNEGMFDSKPKVDFKTRAKELFAKGLTEQQVLQQLVKEGCPPNQAAVFVQGAQLESIAEWLAEEGKASRALCTSSKPDDELGASQLASCKSQGLRARDGEKSHLIGHRGSKVRVTVGGKKIKGRKYGGPLPDYGTRKSQL